MENGDKQKRKHANESPEKKGGPCARLIGMIRYLLSQKVVEQERQPTGESTPLEAVISHTDTEEGGFVYWEFGPLEAQHEDEVRQWRIFLSYYTKVLGVIPKREDPENVSTGQLIRLLKQTPYEQTVEYCLGAKDFFRTAGSMLRALRRLMQRIEDKLPKELADALRSKREREK